MEGTLTDVDAHPVERDSSNGRAAVSARHRRGVQARRLHRVEIHCDRCGYGAVVSRIPDRCPMCGGATWRAEALRGRLGAVAGME
jgi:rubrerythrin